MHYLSDGSDPIMMGMKKRTGSYIFGRNNVMAPRKKRKMLSDKTTRKPKRKAKSKRNKKSITNLSSQEVPAKSGHVCDLCGRFLLPESLPKQFETEFDRLEGEDWFCHYCRLRANSQILKGKDYSSIPGSLLQVFWAGDMRWYTCRVMGKDLNSGITTIKHLTAGLKGVVDHLELSCEAVRWLESSVRQSEATGKFAILDQTQKRPSEQNHNLYRMTLNKTDSIYNVTALRYLHELASYARDRAQCIKPPYYCRTFTMWNANPYYRKGPRQKVKSRVNTISITNMNSRKGELITASFNVQNSEWRVLVYVFGKYQCEGMSVYLQHNRFLDPEIVYQETEFKCTIINVQDPMSHHSREFRHQYTAERSVCGFDIFLPLQDLYNGQYLCGEKKDTIVLQTEIWCYGKEIELPPSPPMSNGLPYSVPWQSQQRVNLQVATPVLEPPRDLSGVHHLRKLDIPALDFCTVKGKDIIVKVVGKSRKSVPLEPLRSMVIDLVSDDEKEVKQQPSCMSLQPKSLSNDKDKKQSTSSNSEQPQSTKELSAGIQRVLETSSSSNPETVVGKISSSETDGKRSVSQQSLEEEKSSYLEDNLAQVNKIKTCCKKEVIDLPTACSLLLNLSADKPQPKSIAEQTREQECKKQISTPNLSPIQTIGINPVNSSPSLPCRSLRKEFVESKSCFVELKKPNYSSPAAGRADKMHSSRTLDSLAGKVFTPSYLSGRLGAHGKRFFTARGRRDLIFKPTMGHIQYFNGRTDDRTLRGQPQGYQLRPCQLVSNQYNQHSRQTGWKQASELRATNGFFKNNGSRLPTPQMMYTGNPYANLDTVRLRNRIL